MLTKKAKISNTHFVLCAASYLILGLLLLKYYRYQLNPDGVAYLSIAEKYYNGDFNAAINGYWGPLFSWLLAPLFFFDIPILLSAKLLSLLVGLLTLVGIALLSERFDLPDFMRPIVLVASIPALLHYALSTLTPDLLATCLITYYFAIILADSYYTHKSLAVSSGIIGALLYLTKSYNFFFFIFHFSIVNIIYYLRTKNRNLRKKLFLHLILGFSTFLVLSSIWSYLLTNKYGKYMIASSGNYNFTSTSYKLKKPIHHQIRKPPSQTSTSIWEDPTYLTLDPDIRRSVKVRLKRVVERILKNLSGVIDMYNKFSFISLATIFLAIILSFQPARKQFENGKLLIILLSIVLYTAGYVMLPIRERYLWPIFPLVLLLSSYVISLLFTISEFQGLRKKMVIAIFIFSFSVIPILYTYYGLNKGKHLYNLYQIISANENINGNLVSNGRWSSSLAIAYHLKSKFYGEITFAEEEQSLEKELIDNDINYFLLWEEEEYFPKFLSNYNEKTLGRVPGLRIYALKENRDESQGNRIRNPKRTIVK